MLRKQPNSILFNIKFVVVVMLTISFCLVFSRAHAQDTGDSYAALSKRAGELAKQGKNSEALPIAERALTAAESEFGLQHETVAKQLGQLGAIYRFLKRPEDVIRVMDRYYDIIEPLVIQKKHSPFDPFHDVALLILSQAHLSLGRGDLQARFIKRWIATSEKVLGYDHPYIPGLIAQLADVEEGLGHANDAARLKLRAADIAKAALQSSHSGFAPDHQPTGTPGAVSKGDLLQLLYTMAEGDDRRENASNAAQLLEFVVQFREKHYQEPKSTDAQLIMPLRELFRLGEVYEKLGKTDQARDAYRKAVERGEKLREENPDNKIVPLAIRQARFALKKLTRDLSQLIEPKGDELALADHYVMLALEFRDKEQYDKAEELLKRAIAIREKLLGPENPDLYLDLMRLAGIYRSMGRRDEARAQRDRADAIQQASERIARETDIGILLDRWEEHQNLRSKFGKHEWSMIQHAVEQTRDYGPSHPFTQLALRSVAQHFLTWKHWRNSVVVFNRIQAGVIETLQHQQADSDSYAGHGKGDITGFKFDAWGQHAFEKLIWASHELARENPGQVSELQKNTFISAQLAQNSPAARALAQMAARKAAGTGKLAELVRERQDKMAEWRKHDQIRNEWLGKNSKERNPAAEAENNAKLKEIEARMADIDRQLADDFTAYTAFANPAPLSVDEAQTVLGEDEALVLFLDTPKAEPMPEQTFIWVVTKTDMRWFRSGLGREALTREVNALRCGLDYTSWRQPGCKELTGQEYSEKSFGQRILPPFDTSRAHRLYRTLFGDAEELLKGKSHLILVPSGALTQLPPQVLVKEPPAAGNSAPIAWLIRDHSVSILPSVSSLKSLRQTDQPSIATKPLIGFGNPLLDGPDNETGRRAKEKALKKQTCQNALEQFAEFIGISRGVVVETQGLAKMDKLRKQAPLPDTADELCEVARQTGADLKEIRLGSRATERELKALSRSGDLAGYRVVHFATHGFLAGELHEEPGLILTPPAPPAEASDEDDGYLTASEIAGLKLDADWVILSACNTAGGQIQTNGTNAADGQPRNAEALTGLARAFIYAQARALLVSHWEVDNSAAVTLITAAMQKIARDEKISRAEALRQAMLDLIKHGGRDAHPAIWAPFVVVGEGGRQAPRN
jgi:CHAT domain-containing protein/tetratricopeptide (TPR) repeat protein